MNRTDDEELPMGPYRGPERRKGKERRVSSDRRDEIRFELDKDDRRSGKDRRRNQGGWGSSSTL